MTAPDAAARRAGATAALVRLIAIVRGHGPGAETWYRILNGMRDVLADPGVPDDVALGQASGMFGALYAAPRNFSEFNIWHEDEAERLRANRELDSAITHLRQNLGAALPGAGVT